MANKDTTTTARITNPMGMCEKLFNAFNPAFKPIRRLTFRHSDPETNNTTPPSDSGVTMPEPPAPEKKKQPAAEPKPAALQHKAPAASAPQEKATRASTPKPTHDKTKTSTTTRVVADPSAPKKSKVHDKVVHTQEPSPPAVEAPPPPGKKNINDKVDDFITRAKAKIRTASFRS